ncbi:hypothetical protein HHL23_09355 [Chryseobacterium sp. RP-3-3]|uniref:Lipoprotein n=1 Tax=Chryseobacterium antibioticum TaxID=2728847 RepID=A0A7Y0FRV3_9FLAO|nr:hypothetical protein [Chryseobacterium antibioticum]NML70006.1 hypothetical protein [Chryseobacterium antibioticum]
MKKLFSIGVLTLVILTSCQNSNEDTAVNNQELANKATELVKAGSKGQESKLGPNDAFIQCHDSYYSPMGNSCVWVDGHLFNVVWNTMMGQGSEPPYKVYDSYPVSHCGC